YVQKLPGMLLGRDLEVPQTSNPDDEQAIIDAVKGYVQEEIDKRKTDPSYVPVSWFWTGNTVFSSSIVGKGVAAAQALVVQSFPDPNDQWQLRVMANTWGIGETSPDICGPACDGIYYGLFPVPIYGDTHNSAGMTEMMDIHDTYRMKDGDPPEKYQDVR